MAIKHIVKEEYDRFIASLTSMMQMDYRCEVMHEIIDNPELEVTHKAYRSRIWHVVIEFLKRDSIINQMYMVTGERDVRYFNTYKKLLFGTEMKQLPLELNNESNIAKLIVNWRLSISK
jgi:hypothetical protein